jgi:hypothetical protein
MCTESRFRVMKTAVAAMLIAASVAGMAAPTHASTDFTPASYSYRVDDPPPADPPSEEAPAPPADCICGGIAGARHNCIRHCQRDGRIIRGQGMFITDLDSAAKLRA